ncbi:STAS/SEC14 domain-containing protein [candidate division WOR-3 bacterium]|nr:STAS/SEC14 domain-containing protein [candidate division WOR-3 bacterium]
MKYKLTYDNGKEILRVSVLASLEPEDIREVMEGIETTFEGKPHRYILADLSADSAIDGKVPKESREVYKEYLDNNLFDKPAALGANSIVRMVAKIILATMKKRYDANFFKIKEEAEIWLTGDMTE